jgi:hypothetical protein
MKPRIGVRAMASIRPSRAKDSGARALATGGAPCGGRASTTRHLRLVITFTAAS